MANNIPYWSDQRANILHNDGENNDDRGVVTTPSDNAFSDGSAAEKDDANDADTNNSEDHD